MGVTFHIYFQNMFYNVGQQTCVLQYIMNIFHVLCDILNEYVQYNFCDASLFHELRG